MTSCHLYDIKYQSRNSHALWMNGLVDGMNRSLQEHLRCIIKGDDKKYIDMSTDVKLFPLAYNSQIRTTFGLLPYEYVFNQSPNKKQIMFPAYFSTNAQDIDKQPKVQFTINSLRYPHGFT